MTEADPLLAKILAAGDVVWQDATAQTKLLVTLDADDLECLAAFRAQAAEHEKAGEYRAPPVRVGWLDAA
jgi:hypothetical protein